MDQELELIFSRIFGGNFQPRNGLICNIEGEGDGDGDGGGGGGRERQFTPEQEGAISAITHKAVSAALTKRMRSPEFTAAIADAASAAAATAIEGATSSIVEQVTGALGKPDGGEGDKGGGNQVSVKDSEEYKALLKRDEDREKRLKIVEDERASEVLSVKHGEEREALAAELRKQGVQESRMRGALSVLLGEDAVIQRSSDGSIEYAFQEDGYTDRVTVADGVKRYLETDEGKDLLPASGARGTGSTGKNNTGSTKNHQGSEKMSKEQALADLGEWMNGPAV